MSLDANFAEQKEISLDFLRTELSAAFEKVWQTAVCLPLERSESLGSTSNPFPWEGAVAWIGGTWTGNVRIGMPYQLAVMLTSRLLDSSDPSLEQIRDTLRELANMTAGNLKSTLPGQCGLATPGNFTIKSLTEVQDEFPSVMTRWYRYESYFFFLSISALHR